MDKHDEREVVEFNGFEEAVGNIVVPGTETMFHVPNIGYVAKLQVIDEKNHNAEKEEKFI